MSVINQNKSIQVVVQNYCSSCGTRISEDSKFCLNCGILLSSNESNVKDFVTRQKETRIEKLKLTLLTTAFLWLSVLAISVFSPDLISGSEQQHLPIVLWTSWLWGLIASIFIFRLFREQYDMKIFQLQDLSISALWLIVALVSIFAPPFVSGSDPTSLPLASLVVPFIGCILTAGIWFLGKSVNDY